MPTVIDLLLTGATGFLGHYLLIELLGDPRVRCRVLLRPPLSDGLARLSQLLSELDVSLDGWIAEGRVEPVEGDLSALPDLRTLGGVDSIVHAAGSMSFRATPDGEPMRTNVEGTASLLGLARELGVRHFAFVSTAYVCGDCTGLVPETVSSARPVFCNDYEQSKWLAEQMVWDWSRQGERVTICRPSILFGDSRMGRSSSINGLYLIARATQILARSAENDATVDRHQIPLRILGRGSDTSNVVAVDWVAKRVAALVLQSGQGAAVHHLTQPHSPTHAQIKDWLEAFFDIGGGRFSEDTWPLKNPNTFEESFYSVSNVLSDYFRHGLSFEVRSAERDSPPPPVDRDQFFKCLQYAMDTHWGRRPAKLSGCDGIDPKWYFSDFVPRTIPRSKASKVEALTAVVRFSIIDARQGEWICRFKRGQLVEVQAAPSDSREEFSYSIPLGEFQQVIQGKKPLQDAFFKGGAEMFGDIERALKMVSVMGEFIKEFPVKDADLAGRGGA